MIYIMNLMTRYGGTDSYSASQHVAQIVRYGGRIPDAVLVHQDHEIPTELALKYEVEKAHQVRLDIDRLYEMGVKIVKIGNIMSATSLVRHDPDRTAKALVQLFEELTPLGAK